MCVDAVCIPHDVDLIAGICALQAGVNNRADTLPALSADEFGRSHHVNGARADDDAFARHNTLPLSVGGGCEAIVARSADRAMEPDDNAASGNSTVNVFADIVAAIRADANIFEHDANKPADDADKHDDNINVRERVITVVAEYINTHEDNANSVSGIADGFSRVSSSNKTVVQNDSVARMASSSDGYGVSDGMSEPKHDAGDQHAGVIVVASLVEARVDGTEVLERLMPRSTTLRPLYAFVAQASGRGWWDSRPLCMRHVGGVRNQSEPFPSLWARPKTRLQRRFPSSESRD